MTEITDSTDAVPRHPRRGIIFFDGECNLCRGAADRFGSTLARRGFDLKPLQTPGAAEVLRVSQQKLLDEVRLLASDGRVIGGADAILQVARHVWWAVPLWLLAFVPGIKPILRYLYRRFVPYRDCVVGRCGRPSPLRRALTRSIPWIPAIILFLAALLLRAHVPAWAFMWIMAAAIFYSAKWLTWRDVPQSLRRNRARSIGYLLAWPGMNARDFLRSNIEPPVTSTRPWMWTLAKIALGAALVWGIARWFIPAQPLVAGWIGMIGFILLLHFGLFNLIALLWQIAGVNARPIMNRAMASKSVGDFWGRRWNRGFSDLMRRYVFDPLRPRLGGTGALIFTFAISGILHELVITLPAGAGWGGPTAYFLIQALAILFERSRLGRHVGLARGLCGRSFVALVTIAPLGLLFPVPFVERVILPFMLAIGAFSAPFTFTLNRTDLIRAAGLLHCGILIASALVPRVLDWRGELSKLQPLTRHLVWVHGLFIVLVIVGFGIISILNAPQIAAGSLLARSLCAFIAIFWLMRLILQFVLFDPRPYLTSASLKLGYHGLTVVFSILVLAYTWCAIAPAVATST